MHNTTVSLALRNSPAIPEETRVRIQKIAEKMGYVPDPMLQALVAYRNKHTSKRQTQTLAYVTNWPTKWGWQSVTSHKKFYEGARCTAAQLGYQLEHFWLGEPGMSQRWLSHMLYHRGIKGVLLAAHEADCEPMDAMEWARFSAIKLGNYPAEPSLHRVTIDAAGIVRTVLRQIFAAGYQRIGFIVPSGWDDFVARDLAAAFWVEQQRLLEEQRVPILYLPKNPHGEYAEEGREDSSVSDSFFQAWYHHHRPDVIVSSGPFAQTPLAKMGVSVPREVAFVDFSLEDATSGFSGVRLNCERVGEVAAEILTGHIAQNLCGTPVVPTATLVEGTWMNGATLPRLEDAASWRAEHAETAACVGA